MLSTNVLVYVYLLAQVYVAGWFQCYSYQAEHRYMHTYDATSSSGPSYHDNCISSLGEVKEWRKQIKQKQKQCAKSASTVQTISEEV